VPPVPTRFARTAVRYPEPDPMSKTLDPGCK
jgi:hypothetical protein